MDRTIIAPWKAEEKELSEKLHQKLQGLALLHPMNDEMRKCLAWDMFLKPNQTAFFQVMHYLFRLLDPVEFKRRFFWPITDKKAEANFRSCTVEYLKHLNEKHQLQWAHIKSYLVVMPGGMKFITFMLEFVTFVVQELIKQREKTLGLDVDASSLRNLSAKEMAQQNVFIKDYASAYIEDLEKNTALLRERTQKLRDIFAEISTDTGIEQGLLLDDCFLEQFEESNRRLCEQKIIAPTASIATLEKPLFKLKEDIEQFQAKQAKHKHNQDAVDSALRGMQNLFGTASATDGPGKMDALINAFNNISETIAEQLDANDHYNQSNEFVTTDLQALRTEIAQIEGQLTDVQRGLNARAKELSNSISGSGGSRVQQSHTVQMPGTPLHSRGNHVAGAEHPLLIKFIATPPIKMELGNRAHVRLPLHDEFNAKAFETFNNNLLAPAPPRSARKPKSHERSGDLNNTINRSKIVDPMQMLRTINKNTSKSKPVPQNNLSALGTKWKQLQSSFGFDGAETPAAPTEATSPKPSAAHVSGGSPHTPFNSHERTRIERIPAKNAAVKKVLDASLNVQNLSTSPSGRLESLVVGSTQTHEQPPVPLLKLNDKTLNVTEQSVSKENDANALNAQQFVLDLSVYAEDDDLQNISDTVLNDISM